MPEMIKRLTIPVAYNVPGKRVGGLDLDHEPVGFAGQFSPYMKNMIVEATRVRKRQGYSRLGTGGAMSGIGCKLASYVDAVGTMHLFAFTTTKSYHYNSTTDVWDDVTNTGGDWTGDADNRFSVAMATDPVEFPNNQGSALCVVNNVDDIQFFEGDAGDDFATLVHGFPSFASCVEIIEFWNHFMILNFTDSAKHVRSLAFAVSGDIDDWSSETAGATTLTDTLGEIRRALKLGTDLMIYSDRCISQCRYVGSPSIFVIPTIIYESGLLAEGAISGIAKAHYFLGTDQKVYKIDRGGVLIPVGETIEETLFAAISMDNKARIATGYDPGRKKILFCLPTGGDEYANKAYVLNIGLVGLPWEYYEFAHNVRDVAILRRTKESAYCDDDEWKDRYVDEVLGYWDDLYGQADFDMACFITDTGYVYKLDEATGYDNDQDIDCEYQTEDLVLGDEEDFGRFIWFSFTAKSEFADISAYVYWSDDGGETWEAFDDSPVTLEQNWKTHRLPLDVVSRRIRFKIAQSGFGDLQLRSFFRVETSISTPRD